MAANPAMPPELLRLRARRCRIPRRFLESTYASQYGATGFDIVADKKGRLVFAGFVRTGANNNVEWLVNRLLNGGAVDPSFNGGNPQQFAIFDSSREYGPSACCVALQSDNRIVVAGTMDRPATYDKYYALARFTDCGAFDSSFGNGGQPIFPIRW